MRDDLQKVTYLVDLFFEALLEHLVGFVEDDRLQGAEVDVASLNMIEDTATGANEEVDTAAQSPCLVLDVDATVDG